MSSTALAATGLEFSYDRPRFSVDVSQFAAEPGVHHLVGLNGSGKSTFLKLLSGVLRPHSGSLMHRGRPIDSADAYREYCRDSGYLWQNFRLRGSTSTRAYLQYRGWLNGLAASEAQNAARAALDAVGMLEAADKAVGKLSGGMQRRLGIIAETLHSPSILLLDEPTSGLDFHACDLVHAVLTPFLDSGATLITAAHDPAEMARYASTVHVMSRGRLVCSRHFPAGKLTPVALRELTEATAQ